MTAKRYYRVIVDGKPINMLSLTGRTLAEAEEYCRGIFGDRLERIECL